MIILVAGAAGPAGQAFVRRFTDKGHTVIGVDKSGADGTLAVDLLDLDAVKRLARDVEAEHGRVDGIAHLVGGWRGGKTFAETKLEDWDLLHDLLVRTLQNVTLAFEPLLKASEKGRFAIVSATGAQRPTQGNAAYATAKAASEAWTLAFADALSGTNATANILVVKALVNDAMRAASPERKFPGFTDVTDLAEAFDALWETDDNGTRIDLTRG
ncbi:SDR family oxidoreductase [Streptosporangium sandarakinum]|uniref:NAD(P)-dependent dehydrogenase (Short-subunit alcohol dehydrogenase family) n=1 Tax=Streptosporangium sandarakinum TaxID=1260955 RepID=A0A852USI7_9ACTN|nr:SDR family oxidoreductase [Streptosporangium sandarakinum]NYF38960.1 NAD(P)-dependent dehydrogenase (short-subunit alcohol dehydrogenase family) [Streptosporangium sandarakinum]